MALLDETGLRHYDTRIKEYIGKQIGTPPKLDNTKTKEDVSDSTDGVYYFTTDTK
jgi:hypothetical protein